MTMLRSTGSEPTILQSDLSACVPPETEWQGRILANNYRPERRIGSGTLTEILYATDLRRQGACVLKRLRPELAESPRMRGRFENEGRLLCRIDHPGIVKATAMAYDKNGQPVLVTEHLHGTTLWTQVQEQHPMAWVTARPILQQIGAAIQHLHSVGIFYPSLHPGHVFLHAHRDPNYSSGVTRQVKLMDLFPSVTQGERGMLREDVQTLRVRGRSSEYLARELWNGSETVPDARADQWALAALAFFLLSGQSPVRDLPPQRAWRGDERVPLLRDLSVHVPVHVERALACALSPQPTDRFASLSSFLSELFSDAEQLARGEEALAPARMLETRQIQADTMAALRASCRSMAPTSPTTAEAVPHEIAQATSTARMTVHTQDKLLALSKGAAAESRNALAAQPAQPVEISVDLWSRVLSLGAMVLGIVGWTLLTLQDSLKRLIQ